ncbi:putative cytokinetic ring protein SteA [Schaalia vaccimaxillae]|uniref:putative cytokinetic ring protein SteA n=1 Tax=Schaalia vaccimaxillae TaxID=183916 RepID=UPI0003B3DE81|nr:putative cytokinetic ring protein SteA [Schaalia vaccimaxillae]
MTHTDTLNVDAHAGAVSGKVRLDPRPRKLATRLEPGDIAVIDQTDLDRTTAQALITAQPVAVLNAAPSASGRHRVLGPNMIVDAGIVLIDDLGQDIMTLREGETVSIAGGQVLRDGHVVASGTPVTYTSWPDTADEELVKTQMRSFAASIDDYLERDGSLLLTGEGVPIAVDLFEGRTVMVIMDDADTKPQLKALRSWCRDADPLVIGVDAGADTARRVGLHPHMIIGDMDLVSEKALRSNARLIVVSGHDGVAPGRDRLDRMGIDYEVIEMMGGPEDAATLIATHSGADAIVTVGAHHSIDDLIDQGRAAMSPSFFTRLRAGDLLVAADAVAATHRPRISAWMVVLFALTVLVTCGVALWATPWGNDVYQSVIGFFIDLIGNDLPAAGEDVG